MVDLLDGLLGGIQGAAHATDRIATEKRKENRELSKEERREMARKLRQEVEAEIQKAHQGRKFAHDKEMAASKAKSESGLLDKRSTLRREEVEAEIQAKKDAGLLEKRPTRVGPFDKIVDAKGETIAVGTGQSATTMKDRSPKVSDKINAQKAAIKALQDLGKPKDKGGIEWERGDPIPQLELDRINSLLKAAGEPEITQETVKKRPGFFTALWDKLFGSGEETRHGTSGQVQDNDPWGIR